jgi:hypothetical protein
MKFFGIGFMCGSMAMAVFLWVTAATIYSCYVP